MEKYMKTLCGVVTAVTLGLLAAAPARAADGPAGLWLTEDGEAKVQIYDCGGMYCGRIVWLKEPNDPQTGQPKVDKFNKDASKRAQSIVGLNIILGMTPGGAGVWKGSLYNPEDGNTFTGSLKVQDASALKLEGCVLALFCRSEIWQRTN
jgi:uncharacterized protein (DUF2147 family)